VSDEARARTSLTTLAREAGVLAEADIREPFWARLSTTVVSLISCLGTAAGTVPLSHRANAGVVTANDRRDQV
jgi:hypothetical protein